MRIIPGSPEMERFHARVLVTLRRHVDALENAMKHGEIAKLDVDYSLEDEAVTVVRIPRRNADALADTLSLNHPGDVYSPRWFRRHGKWGRVFLVDNGGGGTLLLNVERDSSGGLRAVLEPGTTGCWVEPASSHSKVPSVKAYRRI